MVNPTAQQMPGTKSALKAVVLYGELESGLRAKELLQRASDRAGWKDSMESLFWRFDVMSDPDVAREALYRAADVDMVLLAAKGMSTPPDWLLEWLEIWAVSRHTQDAILAAWCEEHTSNEPSSGLRTLRKLARRNALEFLCADEVSGSSS